MKTCGEALVELLESFGIDTVFGIPGVHTVELYRGLKNTRIRHITPRHEQGAGFMADGYARASGRPAACFIITGPGMTNIATSMGQAFCDSIPMLVVSSVNNTYELGLGGGRLHELPSQRSLVSGVCAFSHTLLRAQELPEVLARAFTVFKSARPRPVHIEIPIDVIVSAAEFTTTPPPIYTRPAPDPGILEKATDLICEARRPLVMFGGGAVDARENAVDLVQSVGAVAVATINGKGVMPSDHPLYGGSAIAQPPMLEEIRDADVLLAVGTELGETDTLLFNEQVMIGGQLIRIDIDPGQLVRNHVPEIAIHADAGSALAALAANVKARGHKPGDGALRARKIRENLESLLTEGERFHRQVMTVIDNTLEDAIIVGDSTQIVYSANLFHEPRSSRRYFNSATGYGTLGYALPAAFGAAIADTGRPVVSVIGDGGIQFTIGELAAGVEAELPVIIVLWNNRGYGEIKRYMVDRRIPTIGVDIYTPDFQSIARGFGCHTGVAGSPQEFADLLREARAARKPSVIEIDESVARTWQW